MNEEEVIIPAFLMVLFRINGLQPGKRMRSKDKVTPCKLVKLNEHEEPVMVDPSSNFMRRAKTDPNIMKKRESKKAAKSQKSSVRSRSGRRSVKPSPYKIERVTEISRSVQEESIPQEFQVISEEEKDELEHEILMSKSDLDKSSELSIPELASDMPVTRSRTKEYVVRRQRQLKKSPGVRLDYDESQNVSPSPQPLKQNHYIYSPIRDKVMTPMKMFAKRIQRRVRTTHFINSEHFTNAFLLGIVFLSIMLISINIISKTPLDNYTFSEGANLPYMINDNGHHCARNATKGQRLCAPAHDLEYQRELALLEQDFEDLIHAHNPCKDTLAYPVSRKVSNSTLFESLINNDYFKERLVHRFTAQQNNTGVATIDLKKSFKVQPPLLNVMWCKGAEWLEGSHFMNIYFVIASLVVAIIAISSIYTFCKYICMSNSE